jgi:hypothetical protein
MVIVAGHNMGDIFRRNSFNLGLHVVQSPEAVADAQDGDGSASTRSRAASSTRRRGEDLRPAAAVPKEEEIRRERGHLRRRPPRVPRRRCARAPR